MLELLNEIDRELILLINGACSPTWDEIMLFLSAKWVWVPLYIAIVTMLIRNFEGDFWIPLLFITALIVLTDQTTSSFMKPCFSRLRPCRNEDLAELIRLIGKCGGKYGFASSHAANTMGLAIFINAMVPRRIGWLLISWALMVGFSRIYLGVHFPGDVIVGFILGGVLGLLLVRLMLLSFPKVGERISR